MDQDQTITLTPEDMKHILIEWKKSGLIFGVKFIKQNGKPRSMSCRGRVAKGIKGTGHSSQTDDVITVYDMNCRGYRNITIPTITKLSMKGNTYKVYVSEE